VVAEVGASDLDEGRGEEGEEDFFGEGAGENQEKSEREQSAEKFGSEVGPGYFFGNFLGYFLGIFLRNFFGKKLGEIVVEDGENRDELVSAEWAAGVVVAAAGSQDFVSEIGEICAGVRAVREELAETASARAEKKN